MNNFVKHNKDIFSKLRQPTGQRLTTCPREVVARGGHPLGLIEYVIERVHQVFCHLNYTNLALFGICINPKGCPPLKTFRLMKPRGGHPL